MDYYEGSLTMREAVASYFERNGFGPEGGYHDKWVDFKIGKLPLPFPNTPARVRAVRFHDMHHVLTGYKTDALGEFEISAWEIGAGCRDFLVAWQLNLGAVTAGAVSIPRRTFRAFVRGRRARSLYGQRYAELLDCTVDELRERVGVIDGAVPTASDLVLFMLTVFVGLFVGLGSAAMLPVFVPMSYAMWAAQDLRALVHRQSASSNASG